MDVKPVVHLELYTEYSVKFGISEIEDILDACERDGQNTIAITDYKNIFAWIKFYHQSKKRGIKPICGMRVDIHQKEDCTVLLLCANQRGYEQLLYHTTLSYMQGFQGKWPIEWFDASHLSGLWVLVLPNREVSKPYIALVKHLKTHLSNQAALVIQRVERAWDEIRLRSQYDLAQKHQMPVVATHPICFQTADDFDAHEVRVCIQEGYHVDDPSRPQVFTQKQHFLSQDSMRELFHDAPKALSHSHIIAENCNVILEEGVYHLPQIEAPSHISLKDYIIQLTLEGLEKRYAKKKHNYTKGEYETRMHYELDLIHSMGFSSYFLIVSDFIRWAKEQNIPVGPGRGSGAGSLVAYALGITDLDPLEYQLLFERFLNPERLSMPDFDIDFCMVGRDRVIQYVQKRYGRDCVSQIITYGTMAAKAVVRDVGRALGHPYGMIDGIAKLIPFELGMTLDKALDMEPALLERYERDEEITQLIDLAKKLEGKVRNVGRHAGGVVIAPKALSNFSPLYVDDPSDMPMTQFDKDDLEAIGLVKFDFLGLRTLTLIQWALDILSTHGVDIDLEALPLDDMPTYQRLAQGDTTGVFQLESSGMRDLVVRMKPDCFEDLIALVALYRPGPLQSGMVDDFINRKLGAAVQYPHALCEDILKPTYGVIVYQEQVMQIAQVVASYTLGSADVLRRAMGKKKAEEMASQRSIFIEGSKAQHLNEKDSGDLFDLIEKFAGYGFNKSHSAAYALIAYQTAYIKCHYCDAFMAAVLSSEIDHPEKLVGYARQIQSMSLTLLPPCVVLSQAKFSVPSRGVIRYGLAAIKGVGMELSEQIAADNHLKTLSSAREWTEYAHTKYRLSRKTFEALVKSGAMDALHDDRGGLWASIDRYITLYQPDAPKLGDIFASFGVEVADEWLLSQPWTKQERLSFEGEALGWHMSSHPSVLYQKEVRSLGVVPMNRLKSGKDSYWVLGLIKSARRMMTRSGRRACFWLVEDEKDQLEIGVFDDKIQQLRHLEGSLTPVLMRVTVRVREQNRRYILDQVLELDDIRKMQPPSIRITLPDDLSEELISSLESILLASSGGSAVHWRLQRDGEDVEWSHGALEISHQVLGQLELLGCEYDLRYSTKL